MLTDERIYIEASKHHYIGVDGESCYNFLDFARAIEQELGKQEPVAFVYDTGYENQVAIKFITGKYAIDGTLLYAYAASSTDF